MDFTKLPESRPACAVGAPPEWEDRAMDLAIEALGDVVECDDSDLFVKWVEMPGGHVSPVLFILFGNAIAERKLPQVHFDDLGIRRPAHGVCLARQPSNELLSDEQIGPKVRAAVEKYFRANGVRVTSYRDIPQLPDLAIRRRVLPKEPS